MRHEPKVLEFQYTFRELSDSFSVPYEMEF